jgi:hypothetical protein
MPSRNPQGGGPLLISSNLNGHADGFDLKLFSRAYIVIADVRIGGSYGPGWNALSFSIPQLSNGIYYYQLCAVNSGQPAGIPLIGKVMILR